MQFVVQYFLPLLFFLCFVKQSYLSFLVHFHLISLLLIYLMVLVTPSLINYVSCLFTSLLNLFECSALLLFKQTDTIGKQSQVIFRTFSCKFSGHQFLVKSSIIVFFVRYQVNIELFLSFLLVLIAVHVISRAALMIAFLHVLLLLVIHLNLFFAVTTTRRFLMVQFTGLHIIKKLIIYKKILFI